MTDAEELLAVIREATELYGQAADRIEALEQECKAFAHVTEYLNEKVSRVRAYAVGYDDHVRVELLEILDGP